MADLTENPFFKAFMQGPALAPPPGQTSNFNNPTSLFSVCIAIIVVSIVIATSLTTLRMYTKIHIARKIVIDDLLLITAWVFFILYCAFNIVILCNGTSRHQWDIRLEHIPTILYYFRIASLMNAFAIVALKSSILLQLLKLFNPPKRHGFFFWATSITITIIVVFYTIADFFAIFLCSPIRKYWQPWVPGHCYNKVDVWIAASTVNSFADIMILVLPIKSIWELKMPLKRKVQTSSIFALGLFALAASIVRLYYTIMLLFDQDATWLTTKMGLWILTEFDMLFICACMPSVAKFVRHLRAKFVHSEQGVFSDKDKGCEKPKRMSFQNPYSVGLSTMDHD